MFDDNSGKYMYYELPIHALRSLSLFGRAVLSPYLPNHTLTLFEVSLELFDWGNTFIPAELTADNFGADLGVQNTLYV